MVVKLRRCALRVAAAGVLVSAVVLLPAWADEPGDRATATFFEPLDVPLVNVEATVRDSSGAPITGLTVDDFEVFEDGEPVQITHFMGAAADGGTDRSGGDARRDRVFLAVFLDDTSVDPQLRSSALRHLREVLQGPMPANVSTLLARFDGVLRIESDFAASHEQLVAAIDRVEARAPMDLSREGEVLVRRMQSFAERPKPLNAPNAVVVPGSGSDQPVRYLDPADVEPEAYSFIPEIHQYARTRHLRHRASVEALQRFIAVMGAMPGRKVALWVGGLETRTGENLFRTWQDLFPVEARRRAMDPMMESLQYELTRELDAVLDAANLERISFFPVVSLTSGGGATALSNARSFVTRGRPGNQGAMDDRVQEATLGVMAAVTGGRPLVDNSRLGAQLSEVIGELESFYSLAYRPPSAGDGKLHTISVRVRRDGAVIHHREGYRDGGTAVGVAESPLAAAMLGAGANPFGISAACEAQEPRGDGDYLVPVAVSVPIGELVLLPEGGRHTAQITVRSVVRDLRGGVSEIHERAYPIEIDNDRLLTAVEQRATFVLGMVLREGPHRIAVSVRDERSTLESTVFVDVAVGPGDGGPSG